MIRISSGGKAIVEQILASEERHKSKSAGLRESQSGILVGKFTIWVRSFEIITALTRSISSTRKDKYISRWVDRKNPNYEIFKKLKKNAGNVIILHMCTKNHNHLMYSSWDMEWNRQTLLIWAIFCSFPSYKPENWNFEKMKKNTWRQYHLYTCVP